MARQPVSPLLHGVPIVDPETGAPSPQFIRLWNLLTGNEGATAQAGRLLSVLPTDRLLGRDTPGTGPAEALTVSNGLEFTGSGGVGIANDGVTYARIQNVSATSRVLGRKMPGAGDTEELTLTEVLDFVGSAAQGDILYRGASEWTRLAAGTSGQFLKTNGAGANPAWAAAGGGSGALALLEQQTAASSASLNFTSAISATYDEYLIELLNLIPATDAVTLYMRMSTNGGSTYDSGGNYSWNLQRSNRFGQTNTGADSAATQIECSSSTDNSGTAGFSGHLRLFSPGSTALHKAVSGTAMHLNSDGNTVENFQTGGFYRSTTAVNAFQFLFSSGNISSGIIRVYGIAKS